MNGYTDLKATRYYDIFKGIPGQINVSYLTDQINAWHKHQIQTDYWFCIAGKIRVGLCEAGEARFVDLLPGTVLEITPGIWHGYKPLEPNSVLLYYTTEKYNPDDELRCEIGSFNENW